MITEKPTWKNTIHADFGRFNVNHFVALAVELGYPYVAWNGRVYKADADKKVDVCGVEELDCEHDALVKIADWDLPSTGRFWDDGDPVSYRCLKGVDGEKEYIQSIAKDALRGEQK